MCAGPVAPPQESSSFLLYGEDLAFGGVGVHSAGSTNGKMLESALVPANPLDLERWLYALTVGVCAGQVAVIGEPIVFGIGELTRKGTSNFP